MEMIIMLCQLSVLNLRHKQSFVHIFISFFIAAVHTFNDVAAKLKSESRVVTMRESLIKLGRRSYTMCHC